MNRKLRRANLKASEPTPHEIGNVINSMRQGRYEEAAHRAKGLTERFPDHGFGWKILGTCTLLLGRNGDALPLFLKAAGLLPDDPDIHCNIGIIYYELNQLNEAEYYCRYALKLRPNDAIAHNNLGNILSSLGRLDEAEACFRRAMENNPDLAQAHYNLGCTLQTLGRLEEAESCHRRAVAIRPSYEEAYASLGNVLKEMGRLDEALESWKLSLAHQEDWTNALQRLTNPLLMDGDLTRDPEYPAADAAEGQPHPSPRELSSHLAASSVESLDRKYRVPSHEHDGSAEAGALAKRDGNAPRPLRIVLIYPPLWQIPSADLNVPEGMPFGPPATAGGPVAISRELKTITQGVLSIAAQAKKAGHDVRVYNLFNAPWADIVALIAETGADVYGVSGYNSNRRGMGALCALIRQYHPHAHITVGGPFATTLPLETLRYYRAIDTVVIGEGEETFMELLDHIRSHRPAVGIPGTAWRNGDEVALGPLRPRISDLDTLASHFDYYSSNIVMTSRGCPSKCSFCGNPVLWGRKIRFYSTDYCIDMFRKALARLPVPYLMIADDTFTANQQRTLKMCDAIIGNKLDVLWSCSTRVDAMEDEVLHRMRRAGCQEIMIGVESGSPEILDRMHKGITPEMVLTVTRAAKKYGMLVHYYMIVINRGETPDTLQASIDLIRAGRPNSYDLTPLMFLPGTEDYGHLCQQQGLTSDIFFRNDFMDISVERKRKKDLDTVMQHVYCSIGTIGGYEYTVAEREAVATLLPDVPAVHVELANAYLRAGLFDKATAALTRADELGFPIGNIILNQHACSALARNQIDTSLDFLERACRSFPDSTVKGNYDKLMAWIDSRATGHVKPCLLCDSVRAQDFVFRADETASGLPVLQ